MEIGMLWQDTNPKRDLAAKVTRAATYYENKYHQMPNLCFVNPAMMPAASDRLVIGSIALCSSVTIRPDQFWLGVSEEAEGTP